MTKLRTLAKDNGSLKRSFLYRYWEHRYLVLLFIPAILYYTIFCYGPLYGIQIAFKDLNITKGIWASPWVGLDNFKLFFSVPSFLDVLKNTIIISSYKLLWGFSAPILFAILLNEIRLIRLKKIVQTISYLPHFLSWVVLTGLFTQFLSPSQGPINLILMQLGIKPIYFLGDAKWFRTTLVMTSIWKSMGWNSIIYFAALSNIDQEMMEASIVDGANRFHRAFYITLPSLLPVITIMLILATGSLISDDFDQIFNLYNPAVYKVADVLSTYTYRMGMTEMRYGFSTAVGLFTNIISFALVMGANFFSKKFNEYGIW